MPTTITPEQLEKLWETYQREKDSPCSRTRLAYRNELIAHYLPLVRGNASRMAAKLPQSVDVEDLVQAGVLGLVDALKAFDAGRGVKFQTYCVPRIRGAMLDYLRGDDWVPRLVRMREAKLARATKRLNDELGREPTLAELAALLAVPVAEVEAWLAECRPVKLESLSRVLCTGSGSQLPRDTFLSDVQTDRREESPEHCSQRRDLLKLATRGLNQNERLIVILYYYEELTMKEIGQTLGLSESRVSQMHSALLERLKRQLAGREREFAA